MNTTNTTAIALGLAATAYYFTGYCVAYFKLTSGSLLVRMLRSATLALFWPIVAIAV